MMRHPSLPAVGLFLVVSLATVATTACRGAAPGGGGAVGADQEPPRRHLLIVLDGLRPDYVTPQLMPNLHARGERGVVMTRHHSVYPTVTRPNLDTEIQRIQDGLAAAGLLETTNIWVTSDHGFSRHTGSLDLGALLAPFGGALEDGSPRVVAGAGAVYVRADDRSTVAAIVAALQRSAEVGAVFTRAASPGAREGWVPGTLSFDLARWDHDRSAQILYSPEWTDVVGEYGYAGTSAQGGVAGHGSSSPFDIHNTLVAVGPDVKMRVASDAPSGNVDFAPSVSGGVDRLFPDQDTALGTAAAGSWPWLAWLPFCASSTTTRPSNRWIPRWACSA